MDKFTKISTSEDPLQETVHNMNIPLDLQYGWTDDNMSLIRYESLAARK